MSRIPVEFGLWAAIAAALVAPAPPASVKLALGAALLAAVVGGYVLPRVALSLAMLEEWRRARRRR